MKTKICISIFMLFVIVFSSHAQEMAREEKGLKASELSDDEIYNLSLEELLNMQVTTASKASERLSDAAGVISVITKDELDRFGGLTLRDILERVPGIIGASSAFTERYMIATRGDQTRVNSGHNLILINGRPTREIVEGGISSEMFAAFPVNSIERIEIIKGPGSVLYGSNAFSTVINIITEEAEENNLAVTGLAGESGALGVMGDAKLKIGDLQITGAGRLMEKADWETTYTIPDIFNPGNTLAVDASVPDKAKGAYIDAKYNNLSVMSSYNQYTTGYFLLGIDTVNWSKSFTNIGYELNVGKKWDMDFNVTYNYATLESGAFPGIERNSNDVVAEWTNHIKLSSNSRVIIGGLYNYLKGTEEATVVEMQPDFTFESHKEIVADESRGGVGVYSQIDYWALENLKLIAGFQANKVENVDFDIVPRAGVIWYPVERVNFKALYGQAFRAASVDELGLRFRGFYGNPNLEPEKVATVDIGLNYMGEKIQGGVNYFHNKQSNIIAPGVVDTLYMYINQGTIKFQGVEFEAKFYVNRDLYLTGSMLYQQSEDQDGVKNVSPIANFGAKAGVSYNWSKGITASLFNIYQGKLDEKYTNTVYNPSPGSYNKLNLYINADLAKLFNMNIKQGISLFVQGDNMLNQEIWTPDAGGMGSESLPANPGRTVYIGLKASLN